MRYRSQLVVHLEKLATNVRALKEICPTQNLIFMVKADAYGHGAIPLVKFAYRELGIKEFGLASLGEALEIRKQLPEMESELYVFSDVQMELKKCKESYISRRILPVISNLDDLDFFLRDGDLQYFPLILKFNTGMNRLGISMDERDRAIELIKKSGRKSIRHLMSHLACSSYSMREEKMNRWQIENYSTLKSDLRSAGISLEQTSLANSGAIEQREAIDETHVRPGLMLYGPSSLVKLNETNDGWSGEIISRLETYIIRTFPVKKGDPVGYSSTRCPRDGLMAIIALGYGDGLFSRYRGAQIIHKGYTGEIFGRLNMDMAQVFFPKKAEKDILAGEKLTLWDHDQRRFRTLCEQTKTIPYELFCQLTPRVPRVYRLE